MSLRYDLLHNIMIIRTYFGKYKKDKMCKKIKIAVEIMTNHNQIKKPLKIRGF